MSKSSLEVAAEAAERVNAMLVAKGKLKINGVSGRNSGDLFTTEVEINDAPLPARNVLTKGVFQEEICRTTGAVLSTRGRYMTSVEKMNAPSGDRPLYIHIQAPHVNAIERAMCRINAVMREYAPDGADCKFKVQQSGGEVSAVTTFADLCVTANAISMMSAATTGHHYVQDKIFVGLEHAPPNYPILEKILGPGGSYLDHIHVTTGATVTLRGKGSGFLEPTSGREAFEPLHIHITHPNLEGLQAAKTLAISLIQTTHQDLAEWQQQQLASVALQSAVTIQAPQVASATQVIAGLGQAVFQPVVSGGEVQTQGILVGNGAGGASIVVPVSLASTVPTSVGYVAALPQQQATVVYPTSQVLAHAVVPQHSVASPTMVPSPVVVAQAATPTMVPPPSVVSYASFVAPSVSQPTYVSVAPPTFVSTSVAPPSLMSVPPPTLAQPSVAPPALAPPSVAPPMMVPPPTIPPPSVPPPTLQQPQQVAAPNQHYQVVPPPPPAYIAPTVYPHLRHQYAQYAAAKQGYEVPPPAATIQPQQTKEQQQAAVTTAAAVATPAVTTGNDDWRFRVPPPPLPNTSVPPPSVAPPPTSSSPPPTTSPTPPATTTATNGGLCYRSPFPQSKSSFASGYGTSTAATSPPQFRVPPPPPRSKAASGKTDWDLMPPPKAPLGGGVHRSSGVGGAGQTCGGTKRPSDGTEDPDWKRIRGTP